MAGKGVSARDRVDGRLGRKPTIVQDTIRLSCCASSGVNADPRRFETTASGLVCGPPQPENQALSPAIVPGFVISVNHVGGM